MEEQKNNNSMIKVENNSLKTISKKVLPKISDSAKRLGKIAGWGSLAFVGMGAVALGNAPVAALRNSSFYRRSG